MIGGTPVVFVVDDDASVQRGLKRLLRSAGFTAETFASASEFLERYDRNAPGIVILDLAMPGVDGLQMQKALADVEKRHIGVAGRDERDGFSTPRILNGLGGTVPEGVGAQHGAHRHEGHTHGRGLETPSQGGIGPLHHPPHVARLDRAPHHQHRVDPHQQPAAVGVAVAGTGARRPDATEDRAGVAPHDSCLSFGFAQGEIVSM